jgi:hypothetical protein
MRPWAQWTAKTALLAASFAAAAGGLSGVALAAGGSASSDASPGRSPGRLVAPAGVCDNAGVLLGVVGAACQVGTAVLPAAASARTGPGPANTPPAGSSRSPASPCGSAAAVLGDSTAGCVSGALASVTQPRSASGGTAAGGTAAGGTAAGGSVAGSAVAGGAAGVIQRAVAPVTSVLGVNAPPGTGSFTRGPLAGLQQVSGLAPLATALAPRGLTGDNTSSIFANTPGAGGAGDTNVPAAFQVAGLGALPGLADLPLLAGLANMPARDGVTGGGIPMPGTAMSAANTSGMSSDSFAALAVGALLAGASALKIAGRRARDRKAGLRVAI